MNFLVAFQLWKLYQNVSVWEPSSVGETEAKPETQLKYKQQLILCAGWQLEVGVV